MGYWKHMYATLWQPTPCLHGIKTLTCKDSVYCNEYDSGWPFLGFRRIKLLVSFEAFAALLLRYSFSVISRCSAGWLASDVSRSSLQPRNGRHLSHSDAPLHPSRRFTTLLAICSSSKCFCSSVLLKAIQLQAWGSPECSRKLRLPDFKTIGT